MRKWIIRIGIVLGILVVVLFIGVSWMFREAFAPKYRTVRIKLDEERVLVGNETYNADFAAVFYDVNFSLETKETGTYKLGRGTFSDEHWDKNLELYNIANWIVLPIRNNPLKILLTEKTTKANIDTILNPVDLRYDNLWKKKYDENPAWVYSGSSKLDTIIKDRFFITYEYRIGINPPFEFYKQTIEYYLDTTTGKLKTMNISERQVINNGS